jgi:hypothetical protein
MNVLVTDNRKPALTNSLRADQFVDGTTAETAPPDS